MTLIYVGAVLREHGEDKYSDVGRVFHLSDDGKTYWWIPFPTRKEPKTEAPPEAKAADSSTEEGKDDTDHVSTPKGRLQAYIKRPRVGQVSDAKALAKQGSLSTVNFVPPHEWSLTDAELLDPGKTNKGLLRRTRRDYLGWLDLRDAAWALVQPIVARATELGTTVGHLVESGAAFEIIDQICTATPDAPEPPKEPAVEQALFRYLLGGCEKNSLFPGWRHCGNRGATKYSKRKTGRPNKEAKRNLQDRSLRGYNCTAIDRANLARGYKRYMNSETTVQQAYLSTMEEYYAASVTYVGPGDRRVVLLPASQRPTEWHFRTWGPGKRPETQPSRIKLGEIAYLQTKRPLRGKARDGIKAVGQVGWLDSTPEDQNLVSAASTLKLLPTSYRTMIVDGVSDYILGIYAGFEKSSTMTGLLALLHAGSSKVDWCARYGVTIQEDDWLQFTPRRLRGDNGDLKSDDGISTLLATEVGLEVVRAWWASHKAPVETKHKVLHRNADHLSAGTSRGRQRIRGEKRADESACLTFAQKMPTLIRAILKHNNDDLDPRLLTMEMRSDGVKPTRKEVFKWRVKNKYVVSEPTSLDLLRTKCLPKFRGRIDGGCVMLYDPREPNSTRLIPGLEYWSQWLEDSGLTSRGRKRVIECELQLDPTFPAEAWLNADGMHRLEMRTDDPLRQEVTLCDWILITDDDDLREFLATGERQNKQATHNSSARAANEEGKAAKEAELASLDKPPSKTAMRQNKRANRNEEIAMQNLQQAGLGPLPPAPTTSIDFDEPVEGYDDPDDDPLMRRVRERTSA